MRFKPEPLYRNSRKPLFAIYRNSRTDRCLVHRHRRLWLHEVKKMTPKPQRYPSGTNPSTDVTASLRDRSPAGVELDNMIRRRLRVSNPNNALEVASALNNLYTTDRDMAN